MRQIDDDVHSMFDAAQFATPGGNGPIDPVKVIEQGLDTLIQQGLVSPGLLGRLQRPEDRQKFVKKILDTFDHEEHEERRSSINAWALFWEGRQVLVKKSWLHRFLHFFVTFDGDTAYAKSEIRGAFTVFDFEAWRKWTLKCVLVEVIDETGQKSALAA